MNCERITRGFSLEYTNYTLGLIIPIGSMLVIGATHEPEYTQNIPTQNISDIECDTKFSGTSSCSDFFSSSDGSTVSQVEPSKTIYGFQLNIDFLDSISLKLAYDTGKVFNNILTGQLFGFDFNDISISNGSREYTIGNLKYSKNFTTMNFKYFGGLIFSYYEIQIKDNYGKTQTIKFPSISYNVKFDLTGRKCDVWADNKLTSCGS